MYYGDSDNPYRNINLKFHFKEHLPMDEFVKGNFSQAHKITNTYNAYIKQCLELATRKETGGTKSVGEYLQEQLVELKQQHKERTEKKVQAIQNMKDIQKNINKIKKPLKDARKGNEVRKLFFDFWDKNAYDLVVLRSGFENSKEDQPEKYKENKSMFEKFFALAEEIDDEKINSLQKQYLEEQKTEKEATRTLSRKSNRMNLDKQIDDISTNKAGRLIRYNIKKNILQIFKKIDHLGETTDGRSLQEIYTSTLTAHIITDHKTDRKIKNNLIKNHTDKIGLFDHVRRIYMNNTQMFLELETERDGKNHSQSANNVAQEHIEKIVYISREKLNKIRNASPYFWINKDVGGCTEISYENKKKNIIEDLITHLKEALQNPEKEGNLRQQNTKIDKLFKGVYAVTENYEFENYCEKLWNIDANKYWDIIGIEGKMLLKQIYQTMDEQERNITSEDYNSRGTFEEIQKEVSHNETHNQDKQLELYDFAPIYKVEGYLELVITHIQLLIGTLSFKHKMKFECITSKMIAEQGHNRGHIDTGKKILSLSDQDFIERVKDSRGGKALSTKLKKIEGKLLPDINEWISEKKGVVKN